MRAPLSRAPPPKIAKNRQITQNHRNRNRGKTAPNRGSTVTHFHKKPPPAVADGGFLRFSATLVNSLGRPRTLID